jgi:hypothetical protein
MNWKPYTLDELCKSLNGLTDWFLDGGYSLELFLGEAKRSHGDIDIGVYACDAKAFLQALVDREYGVHIANKELALFNQFQFCTDDYNYWIYDKNGYRFQLLVYEVENGKVHFRRNKGVSFPQDSFLITINGIAVINPLVTFAFKVTTKSIEQKDLADIALLSRWVASQV